MERVGSPSLMIGPILIVGRYSSSPFLGKHGAEPKLGSHGRCMGVTELIEGSGKESETSEGPNGPQHAPDRTAEGTRVPMPIPSRVF
jgi:hypothetical protein